MQPPNSFSTPKEWADFYRSLGLAPIPANVNKHPTVEWKSYQDGVPQEVHNQWFANSHSYSMGFLTGKASGNVFVVDLDTKLDPLKPLDTATGLDTWRGLLAVHNNGLDVETYEAKTGSGGRHLYFWVPPDKTMPQTTKNKWRGIDIRGRAGFIMAPPSPHHIQGSRYEWIVAPWDGEIMEAPPWLLDTLSGLTTGEANGNYKDRPNVGLVGGRDNGSGGGPAYGDEKNVPGGRLLRPLLGGRDDLEKGGNSYRPSGGEHAGSLDGLPRDAGGRGLFPWRGGPLTQEGRDSFGNLVENREQKMTDIAFAVVTNAYRNSPIKPVGVNDLLNEAYQTYLAARPKTRIPGVDNEAGLEREGRGRTYMAQKVERYWREWDTLIATKAKEPQPKKPDAGSFASASGEWGGSGEGAKPSPIQALIQDADSEPFPATDFKGKAPERVWLWKDWIPEGIVASLYGDGGVGKSLLAQQLCYALGAGGRFLGQRGFLMPKKKVMAAFCEDDEDELHRRHDDIVKSMGGFAQPFTDVMLWPRVGFDNLLVTYDKNGKAQMSAFFEKLCNRALDTKTEFLVLDTAADLFGGNENIRADVNFFIKSVCGRIIKLAKDRGFVMTVLILAHPSQSGKEGGGGTSGSTAWNNAVRSRLYITKPEDGLPEQRTLTRMKSNYSASGSEENLELVWSAGILELTGGGAAVFDDRGNANIDVIKSEVYNMVKDAWERGELLTASAKHPRSLDKVAKDQLTPRGYQKNDIIEAISRLRKSEEIIIGKKNDTRGYKPAFLMNS